MLIEKKLVQMRELAMKCTKHLGIGAIRKNWQIRLYQV